MPDEVMERVKKVVGRQLKVGESALVPDARFSEDLGSDSMRSVELIAAFDAEFDLDMDIDEAGKMRTIGHAVEFIKQEIEKKS